MDTLNHYADLVLVIDATARMASHLDKAKNLDKARNLELAINLDKAGLKEKQLNQKQLNYIRKKYRLIQPLFLL